MKRLFIFFIFFTLFLPAFAASVDTVSVYSTAMGKDMPVIIIRPDSYDGATAPFPAVYLLHGAGGDYANWLTRVPSIQQLADTYQMIIVCPDGGTTSWYFDSPVDPAMRYETFIAKELVTWVDGRYQTIRGRAGRAITGLSMGGHGAFYLALRHPEIWGAAGSMSGGVDLRPFPDNWSLSERLGPYATHPENWENNSVINMLYLLSKKQPLALLFDCGTDDFFLDVNRAMKREMDYRNIPHTYIERPGAHNWEYWSVAVQYQLLFFSAFFGN